MRKLLILMILPLILLFIVGYSYYIKNKGMGEIKIAGASLRTTNQKIIDTGGSEVMIVYQKVFDMEIPNLKDNARLFVAYSDFDENFKNDYLSSEYTMHIGFEVSSHKKKLDGVDFFVIKSGKYEVFETKEGKISDVVFAKWQDIWKNKELLEKRNFISDFEVYESQINPEKAKIKIYIGVK
jgi:predicted transcriptional regulator YdeE